MNRQAFESVPVPSTRITDIYLIALARLNEVWDDLAAWASLQDEKEKQAYEERKAADEKQAKEALDKYKKYNEDLAAWEKESRFTRGKPPEGPPRLHYGFGLMYDPYWYHSSLYDQIVELNMEIETMLQAAKEAEVVKLDQSQFLRMMKFNDDKVVSEWVARMKA